MLEHHAKSCNQGISFAVILAVIWSLPALPYFRILPSATHTSHSTPLTVHFLQKSHCLASPHLTRLVPSSHLPSVGLWATLCPHSSSSTDFRPLFRSCLYSIDHDSSLAHTVMCLSPVFSARTQMHLMVGALFHSLQHGAESSHSM